MVTRYINQWVFIMTIVAGSSRAYMGGAPRFGGVNVNGETVHKMLRGLSFTEAAQKGSHLQMMSPIYHEGVTIPLHSGKDSLCIKTFKSIIDSVTLILNRECLNGLGRTKPISRQTVEQWALDPKAYKHEIHAMGKQLDEARQQAQALSHAWTEHRLQAKQSQSSLKKIQRRHTV